MNKELQIRDVFRLPSGLTVLACEGTVNGTALKNARAALVNGSDEARQEIRLNGERAMLNPANAHQHCAIETLDRVDLSAEEAQSGLWRLLILS